MPRLTLLATISVADESSFALLLAKLSSLPMLTGEREINLLPRLMLVTDLLRFLRQSSAEPLLSIFLEQGAMTNPEPCQLIFQIGSAHSSSTAPPFRNLLTPELRTLLETYQPHQRSALGQEDAGLTIAAPLSQAPSPETNQALANELGKQTREQLMANLEVEKQKAITVLHKIFPESVAKQLEDGASTIYDYHPSTTILFSDMVGFTAMSKSMEARNLVTFIDDTFRKIDELCMKYGVEKIKTIGDSYMAAAGVPEACDDHAERIANLAFEIQALHNNLRSPTGGANMLQARIGIHSGPVVAGVIGLNKYTFDLWGDTVNVASRMESTGIPGEIQLSIATRKLLPDRYFCHIRGHVAMKGHDSIETFLLRGVEQG
jgi:class 3 adenylate cyclase